MQNLFLEAKYKEEAEKKDKKELCAVEKHRVRRKCKFPRNIWDGEDIKYCFRFKIVYKVWYLLFLVLCSKLFFISNHEE